MNPGSGTELIELLTQHELRVAKLYQVYQQHFPNPIWDELVKQEEEHASWLRSLGEDFKSGKLTVKTDRFQPAAINTSMHFLDQEMARAYSPGFKLINALAIAHAVETSLLERDFFKIFAEYPEPLKQVFEMLTKSTNEHRLLIEAEQKKH